MKTQTRRMDRWYDLMVALGADRKICSVEFKDKNWGVSDEKTKLI